MGILIKTEDAMFSVRARKDLRVGALLQKAGSLENTAD